MNFVFYKYDLARIEGRTLYDNDEPLTFERALSVVGSMLEGKSLNLTSERNDETIIHQNEIIRTVNGVTIMRICNTKKVMLWEQYKQVAKPSNPFLLVIIDNREDAAQIAVEKGPAFDNTDKVCEILRHSFNQTLRQYGWEMEVRAKKKIGDLWEAVDQRLRTGDTIKQIEINFPSPKQCGPVDANDREPLAKMQAWVELTRALGARSQFKMLPDENGDITLDRTKKDVINIFQACCNNGYEIDIKFQKIGMYRVGKEIKAIYDIEDKYLTQFIHGQLVAWGEDNFDLITRLDEIRTLTKDLKDGEKIDRRTGKRHKEASGR